MNRIWVRFGWWIAATVLLTTGILAASAFLFSEYQYRNFERSLPASVQMELNNLVKYDQEDSPRALEIYIKYWKGDQLFGEKLSLIVGLAVCIPVGLIAGFLISRAVTLPLGSMAEAAQRIARGDMSVRAHPGRDRGEMADMVRHFNDMASALESFEGERKIMTAAISHELRTPLTILRAQLHAVCDGVVQPGEAQYRQWLDQTEHLGRLVDDLHTLSMAEAGRLSLRRTLLDLVTIARETLSRQGLRLSQAGIEAHVLTTESSVWVLADEDRMRQVMSNLVENALRHAHAGGWLEIGVHLEGEADASASVAVISVSDAGPGLSEEARRSMSQRSALPVQPRRSDGAGSGLGLSIVQMLVAQHGGQIGVETSQRGGSRFTIRMPVAEPVEVDKAAGAA